ncbi:hypothetical protein [Maricaulis sp.]|uniref:hypothetical protein n=1 Tax=Maricaulis sp. TaxID=1486257 RepID=UPI002B274408|nr:hypothetical protein [Maricaulis sp.]
MLSIFALAATLMSTPLTQVDAQTLAPDTLKPVKIKRLQGEFARSLAVEIRVASPSPVILTSAELTGGNWDERPLQGSDLNPGQIVTYTNGNDDPHDALGGTMTFSVACGDRVSIAFEWAEGSPPICTAATQIFNPFP